ncbi:peptidoglycan-recognition protein LB-like [Leptidea sinapis]|uniref:peptidoglycan-recognition protein LB-like n=1 Tax=Leptidea sinapis TaxID=189913 RepID=UPI00212BFFA9|nr:peptidoglycan-recognition protein LB-like [Leptidea sinapis]XP_050677637.1 peptidoglycan-recognition protein LB-like [Leptidea sinapis]XP_050677638.1 peptidoglycan-recognition protein LB-like [Leptidea sinapis]XP_050677639.1 peptidoglycan-recognition protein LB-like [Leptidea sinapis]
MARLLLFMVSVLFLWQQINVMSSPAPIDSENEVSTYDFEFVPRSGWNADTPKQYLSLSTPVPFVVIHHSYSPPACFTRSQCEQAMTEMLRFHVDTRGWWDIGYNFAVGGDGSVYEGRGWEVVGAHSLHFNNYSIGICLIGDWTDTLPPAKQLQSAKSLISAGVDKGYINVDYKLVGHRQVRETECPGDALFREIQKWKYFSNFPASKSDLIHVKEIPKHIREQWKKKGL